ncbi:uncharacterized protein [Choristoneura fumiferana]|uniref:uncharacterized protein n=1 Tax=Choristoneura fumiferana TaxID=7141 RepID=UPI003D155419
MHALILLAAAATATAMPSFIAVPADQIAFVDLSALRVRRVPRQTLTPPPPPPSLPQVLYREEYAPAPIQYQHQPIQLAPEPEAPARIVQIQGQPDAASSASALAERPPDFGEYVDFGAHTGDNGAFGWYADYPINNHDDSSYRK